MTFGVKQKGFNCYYLCDGTIRISTKGYRTASDHEIHEVGAKSMIEILTAAEQ